MQITFYGQSCFHIKFNKKDLVFDPFISPNEKANHINVDEIKADYVLLSHAHLDHIADADKITENNDAVIISGYEVATHFGNKGFKHHPLNHGGKWKFDFGTVKMTNAIHSSSFKDGSYGGYPGGFVVYGEQGSFYFAGDTALTMDMKLIPMTCPKLDFAILPIGDNFTMGYEDAVIASQFIECDTIIGCHYDTFGFIEIDHNAAVKAFEKAGKKLILPEIGKTFQI